MKDWRLPRYAVFASGRGSNLAALLDLPFAIHIKLVVSDKPRCLALARARKSGIATLVLAKPIDWQKVHAELNARHIQAIFLAGFMRILPADFVQLWEDKILNVHPSLLPLYPGLHSIQRAFADRNSIGVTVHRVTAEMDAGPIILQRKIDDLNLEMANLDEVEFKVHLCEHRLVRKAVLKCTRNLK